MFTKQNLSKKIRYKRLSVIFIGFILFWDISTIVGYLMPNPLHTHLLNIYDLETYFVDNIFNLP